MNFQFMRAIPGVTAIPLADPADDCLAILPYGIKRRAGLDSAVLSRSGSAKEGKTLFKSL